MRMLRAVSGVLIALGLMTTAPAHASTERGKTSFRGWWGYTSLTLGDINNAIRSDWARFQADTLAEEVNWNAFGGAPNLGLELEVQITPGISAGLGFSSQRGSRRLEAVRSLDDTVNFSSLRETFEEDLRFSAWDVVGTLGFWLPSAPGLHAGVQLGVVRGKFETDRTHFFDSSSELPFQEFTRGEWKGTGVVLGAFSGYDLPLSSTLSLSSRMGYRYRNIKSPKGTLRSTLYADQGDERRWETGPLLGPGGNPLDLDLGGLYFNVGLCLGLGGRE